MGQCSTPAGRRIGAARVTWPLTGREPEMETLRAVVDEPGTGAVIVGPEGAGRTRLVREAAGLADAAGRTVLHAAASATAATVPLEAVAHLIPSAPTGAQTPELLAHAAHALTAESPTSAGPPVLVVDDAHLLDALTVTLVHRLAAARSATLIAAVADHATDPLADLWRDDHATRIDLAPLDRSRVERLLSAALGAAVDSRTTERLWRLSEGNLRVLRELVEGGRADGRLRPVDGLWRWSGPMAPTPRLTRIVLGRVAGLDAAQRRALDLLAVAGPLPMSRMLPLTGRDVVAGLERAGLLTVRSADAPGLTRVRLTQPVHAVVLAEQLPSAEAGHLRRLVADDGAAADRVPDGRLLLDSRSGGGGSPDVDPTVLLAAAHEAARQADHELAERLARAAADAGGGARAHTALVEALIWQGRTADAERIAAAAWSREQHRLTAVRAFNLQLGLHLPDDALRLLDLAGPDDTGLLDGTRALLALRCDVGEAVRIGSAVLDRPGAVAGHPLAAAAAAIGLALQGRVDDALAAVATGTDALARPEGRDGPGLGVVALEQARLTALLHAGHVHEHRTEAERMHRRCLSGAESAQDAVAALHRGAAALLAGRVDEAARWLTEADQGLGRADPLDLGRLGRAWLATARALLGDLDTASALLQRLGDDPMCDPQVIRAGVWVAAADQRVDDAGALALRGAARAAAAGQPAVQAGLLHDAVRLGRAADAAVPLLSLAVSLGTPLVSVAAEHAAALLAEAPARLDAAATRFEELGALLPAADTAADAAASHHRAGHRRRSSAAAARATALAESCGDPHTPALRRLDVPRLTARERDVAGLAADGLSNQVIARRLVVSVRTVETHLAHAYTKLGVAGRAELASVLAPG